MLCTHWLKTSGGTKICRSWRVYCKDTFGQSKDALCYCFRRSIIWHFSYYNIELVNRTWMKNCYKFDSLRPNIFNSLIMIPNVVANNVHVLNTSNSFLFLYATINVLKLKGLLDNVIPLQAKCFGSTFRSYMPNYIMMLVFNDNRREFFLITFSFDTINPKCAIPLIHQAV